MNYSRHDIEHIEREHTEALAIQRQLDAEIPELSGQITSDDVIALNRFWDCCEDGEGYDVPKEQMKRLCSLGIIDGGKFGRYWTNELSNRLREHYYAKAARTSPVIGSRP